MNRLMRTSAFVLALGLLAGCASLPLPEPTKTKLLAVIFDRGEGKTAYFKQVTFFVTTSTNLKPIVLKSGINFLPVPADSPSATLLSFGAAGTVTFVPTVMFEQPLNVDIDLPDDQSLVLWPVVLGFKAVAKNGQFRGEGTLTPMKPEKVESLLNSWRNDKNSAAWNQILAAP